MREPEAQPDAAGGRRTARLAAVVGFAFIVFLARQPLAILRPQFVWEEASAYWATTFTTNPIEYLFDPWVGYLHVGPRAVFLAARFGPPEIAPLVTDVIHAAIVALICAFVASDRLRTALPDRRLRLAFGLAIPLLPIGEPFDSPLSMQWFLALYVAALALADDRRWYDYVAAGLAVLSGIAVVIAAPLLMARRDRLAVVVTICAAIQLAVVALAVKRHFDLDPSALVQRASIAGIGVLVLAAIAVRELPIRTALAFGYVGVATALAGALALSFVVADPSIGGRYFFALVAAVALVAIAATIRGRPVGMVLGALLAIQAVGSFLLPVIPDQRWASHARCIGGPVPCQVPIYPADWSVSWPGDDSYVPRPFP